jgi:hypothetical protein
MASILPASIDLAWTVCHGGKKADQNNKKVRNGVSDDESAWQPDEEHEVST